MLTFLVTNSLLHENNAPVNPVTHLQLSHLRRSCQIFDKLLQMIPIETSDSLNIDSTCICSAFRCSLRSYGLTDLHTRIINGEDFLVRLYEL